MRRFSIWVLWLLLLFSAAGVTAQGDLIAQNIANLNVRTGPGTEYTLLGVLPSQSSFVVEARNWNGSWLLVHTQDDTLRGWVASRYVYWDAELPLGMLPVSDVGVTTALPGEAAAYEAALLAELEAVPLVSGVGAHAQEIAEAGLGYGNRPQVLAKVGDCNTESYAFLGPLDVGNYDLGPYTHLEPTVAFFNGSFAPPSVAGRAGFSALSVLDALWADTAQCQPGESPLWCEYRLTRPGVAVIMFGMNDVYNLAPEQYEQALRRVVELSIRHGTVPLVSTFAANPEGDRWLAALELNRRTVAVARAFDVPLVNFWLAARDLPHGGMASDNLHLSYSGTPAVSFHGEETQWGFSARNLVTLQALDEVRRGVFGE